MSNKGSEIVIKQNTDEHIQMLAAQSYLYSRAKHLFIWQTIIAVPVPLIISIFTLLFDSLTDKIIWIFALYTVMATFGELIFGNVISNLKKTAASIQEVFDKNVLGIPWNDTLLPTKPGTEVIYKNYMSYKKSKSIQPFYDWYSPEVKEINTNLATMVCQRTNCTYDFSLRKLYKTGLILLTTFTFVTLVIITVASGITMKSFFVNVVLPVVPVFVFAIKQITGNQEAISNLSELKNLIENNISTLNQHSQISEILIRQIQDKIYYNRILSPLLPDWIFKKKRTQLEAQMHFTVRDTVRELKSRLF